MWCGSQDPYNKAQTAIRVRQAGFGRGFGNEILMPCFHFVTTGDADHGDLNDLHWETSGPGESYEDVEWALKMVPNFPA